MKITCFCSVSRRTPRRNSARIGTTPQGTLVYAVGTTIAKALFDSAKIDARVQPTSGTSVLVPMVNSGELDMGFCGTLELYDSFHGVGTSDKRPNANLRAIAILFPNRFGLFVRNDSPIRAAKDLSGKRVPFGFTNQASSQTVVEALLANAGLTVKDVQPVTVSSLTDGVDAFVAGRVDVAFFAIGQAKVAAADAAVGGIRFLAVDPAPAAVAALQRVLRTAYVGRVDPAPNLPGVREPLMLAQYDVSAFVNANLPAERVRAIVRVLAEERDALALAMPAFRQMRPERMYARIEVPYHDGAIAYFRDRGISQAR